MTLKKAVLVKTSSEIALKTTFVRKFFNQTLLKNIKQTLSQNAIQLSSHFSLPGRLALFTSSPEDTIKTLQFTAGIHSLVAMHYFPNTTKETIAEHMLPFALPFLTTASSFKVAVARTGKQEYSSKQLEEYLGGVILEQLPHLKVNLSSPQKTVFIEVRDKHVFMYSNADELSGMQGLPLGVEGNSFLYCTNTEQDITAAQLVMKRGTRVYPLLAKSFDKEKQTQLLKTLIPWNNFQELTLHPLETMQTVKEKYRIHSIILPFTSFQEALPFITEWKQKGFLPLTPLLLGTEKALEELHANH